MTAATMVGTDITILVSEPWEFCSVNGAGPFLATVLAVGPNHWYPTGQAILLRLRSPVTYKGAACEYFIASPRYEGGDLQKLATGTDVDCGLTHIPADRAASANPFDLAWWRGGVGLIATLRRS